MTAATKMETVNPNVMAQNKKPLKIDHQNHPNECPKVKASGLSCGHECGDDEGQSSRSRSLISNHKNALLHAQGSGQMAFTCGHSAGHSGG